MDFMSLLSSNEAIITIILSLIIVIGFIGAMFRIFEKSKPSVEYTVLLAVLIAVSVVAMFIGSVTRIQIAPFIVIMAGVVFGKENGFIVGALSVLVFGLISGFGIGTYTPYEMIGFGLMGFTAGIFSIKMDSVPFRAIFGFVWGFLYGWITNLSMFYFVPLTMDSVISTYLASVSIDGIRAVCTLILLVIAYNWFKQIFERSKYNYVEN